MLSMSQLLYPILTFPYVSRVLQPDGLGAYNFIESVARYFILIAALGTPIYGVRKIASLQNKIGDQDLAFREVFTLNVLMTFFCCLIYFLVVRFLPGFEQRYNLYVIGLAYVFANGITCEWYFIGREDFKYLFFRTIIVRILMIICVFIFVKTVNDLESYFLINTLSFIVLGFSNVYFVRHNLSWPLVSKIKFSNLKRHFKPLIFIFSSIFAVSIYLIFDTIILRLFTNDVAVGYYTAATKLNKVILTFLTAISTVLLPKLSLAFSSEQRANAQQYLEKSLQLTFLICLPAMLFTFCLSKELIVLFSGPEYLAAIPTMRILTPIILIIGLTNVFGLQILNSLGKDKQFLKAVLLGAIVSLTLNLLLIPKIGLNGAAVSNLTAESTVLFMVFYYSRKEIKLSFSVGTLAKSMASSFIFIPIAYGFKYFFHAPMIVASLSLFVGGILYIISNLFLGNKILVSAVNQILRVKV